MKSLLENTDKAFDHRIRLVIMSVLMVNESADFNTLKEFSGVIDGDLANYIRAFEAEEYIIIEKSFVEWKTNTSYKVTKKGREAFQEYLNVLGKLVNLSISRRVDLLTSI